MKTMVRFLVFFFVAQWGLQTSLMHLCSDGAGAHLCVDACPSEHANRSESNSQSEDPMPAPTAHHECGHVTAVLVARYSSPFFESDSISVPPLPQTAFYQGLSDIFHPPA